MMINVSVFPWVFLLGHNLKGSFIGCLKGKISVMFNMVGLKFHTLLFYYKGILSHVKINVCLQATGVCRYCMHLVQQLHFHGN